MTPLKFFKVSSLPGILEPSSVYLIPDSVDGILDIHVSDKSGIKTYHTLTPQDVDTLVQSKVTEILSQTQQVIVKVYKFDPTLQLDIKHNLNTTNYSYSIVNAAGDRVWAPDHLVDANEFTVDFTDLEAGTISVVFYVNT